MSTRMTKDTAVEDTFFFIIFDKVCIFFLRVCDSSLKNATLFFDNYKKTGRKGGRKIKSNQKRKSMVGGNKLKQNLQRGCYDRMIDERRFDGLQDRLDGIFVVVPADYIDVLVSE